MLILNWRAWLPKVLLILGLTFWIYWPARQGELIWDDQWYIKLNPLLHDATGLWKFWFRPGSWVEFYPIQETVLWLQYQLWGESNTLGYHLTNVFLHIVNSLLVWRLLSKFGLRFAWVGGLIFAIHPVQVESVAYICELKNTLSLPLFLLAMMAWIDFDESRSKNDYEKALGFYLLGMLCKISMAPFAAVILLYAWWKRGRIERRDVIACAPFLLIAMILAYTTIWAGNVYEAAGHAVIPETPLTGMLSKIDAIGLNATVYFQRCFLPADILMVYPQWPLHPHDPLEYLPWFVLVGILVVLWKKRQSWGRHVMLGLGFFLLMLAPFLGFLAVSYMNFIWVLDHILYLPIIGLIGLVVAGAEGFSARLSSSWDCGVATAFAGALFILMIATSRSFAGLFVSELVLWHHILDRNPNVWLAHDDLACKLMELERYPEAIDEAKKAIALRPEAWDGYFNVGLSLEKLKRPEEAEAWYRKSLELKADNSKIYLNLGEMKRHAGDIAAAEIQFREGLKYAPDDASLANDLAGIFVQTGRVPEAVAVYQHIADLNPNIAQIQYNLGNALLQTGRLPEAVDHLSSAAALDPKIAAVHENLGSALGQLGRQAEAIDEFQKALEINPASITVHSNLALALAQTGRIPEAIAQFQQVLQLDPKNARAQENLAKLQQFQSQQAVAPSR